MPWYDACTLLWLKMYMILTVEVKYFIFYFLGWILVPLSLRNIEATLSLSSGSLSFQDDSGKQICTVSP